jgi:mono/diheme cytochrome c family protein
MPAVPLAALSSGHKIGLAVAAAIFIVFSLVVALVIPRWRPDFPGRGRGLFILVTLALFVGMMAAVFVFGKEEEESEASETPATETAPPGQPVPAPPAPGNAAAGKQVFQASGCGSCHTYEPAGSKGQVGPDLSQVLQDKDAEFIHESIVDPNAEVAEGYQANVMPQNYGDQLSNKQVDDLVAFLQRG